MKTKLQLRDYIFYAVLISLVVWVYLKKAGYFNTPLIVEMYPILGLAFLAGSVYQRFVILEDSVKVHDRRINIIERKIN